MGEEQRIVRVSRHVAAPAEVIFEMIADPSRQPEWDGNENLAASGSPRVRSVGEVFEMTLTKGTVRENHVVEFDEGRAIAWCPAEPGSQPVGHLWRWELSPAEGGGTTVSHTYDWTNLHDAQRLPRARATGPEQLRASVDRLAAAVESDG